MSDFSMSGPKADRRKTTRSGHSEAGGVSHDIRIEGIAFADGTPVRRLDSRRPAFAEAASAGRPGNPPRRATDSYRSAASRAGQLKLPPFGQPSRVLQRLEDVLPL
jgi:hypothetical protein